MCRNYKGTIFSPGLFVDKILGTRFYSPLRRQALIDGDAMKPRRDLRLTAEIRYVAIRRDKRFLSGVAGIVLASEHTEAEREYLPLPPFNDFAESLRISRNGELDKLFIGQFSQHQARVRCLYHENSTSYNLSNTKSIAFSWLDDCIVEKVE